MNAANGRILTLAPQAPVASQRAEAPLTSL
jgi:hypothetical protein